MDELLARLEKAEGPDRELDWEIELTRGTAGTPGGHELPRYTGSLDAALTLVPEHHRFLIDKRPYADEGRPDGYRCQVYKQGYPYRSDGSDTPTAWASSPALALCIAALRARNSAAK